MSYNCHGIWFSWLGIPRETPAAELPIPNDIGFHIKAEQPNGTFDGHHLSTGGAIKGQCGSNTTTIHFSRVENVIYVYHGDISDDDSLPGALVARGKRQTLFWNRGEVAVRDDEEWIGVKTT